MRKYTVDDIMALSPCDDYGRHEVTELWAGKSALSAIEIVNLDIPIADKFWAVIEAEMLDDRQLRLLAADYAEHVLHIFEKERPGDDRPRKAIIAARQYANGEIGDDARDAAWAAARDAARDDARDDAWNAAWAAAGAAARNDARNDARDAAWNAAWAAARNAAGDDAWNAAGDDAWDAAWAAARNAAGDDAWNAAGDDAWDAARNDARDAAWNAENTWQLERVKAYIREDEE